VTAVRRNPITGEPVLVAPERAGRPFASESADCPFCPGHEHETPPELVLLGDPWRARVFPNKYPAVAGAEVIVESPRHGDAFHDIDDVEAIVALYVDRIRAHGDAKSVSLFKNEGAKAGASIAHVHSQLIPLAFVPPRIETETAGFARAVSCPLCSIDGSIIRETEHFLWLAPAASRMAYQQWIVPRRHFSDVRELGAAETRELAALLRASSSAMKSIADAYNWMFLDFRDAADAHFYVELFPRMSVIAGFELGSGTFVEIIEPAEAAERLSR
jgi:UDPglucose--hexose-1-phosphate uridylyltransferase